MEKILFDSHAHINEKRFDREREGLCREIESSQLAYVMDIGFDFESSVKAVEDAANYEFCYAAVGCHPHDAKTMDEAMLVMFKGLAKKPKVKAIGEIGLDYYYDYSERDVQQYWFRRQIQLALQLRMPIVIHDRDANDDVMRILKEEGVFRKERTDCFPPQPDGSPDARLLLHCYSGSKELARQYVMLGATISIAGPITFKNSRKAAEVVESVDLSRLLIETDSPYLAPEPCRGKTNRPVYVEHTARKVAEIKGLSFEETAAATCENARRFFGIDE